MNIKKIARNAVFAGLMCLLAASGLSGCGSKANPKVEVEMENGDKFVIELYPEYAPKTVDNFVKLVNEGFYDGLTFHRIVDGFVAQGGGYNAAGAKKDTEMITGEFSNNGYTKNTLKHTKGVISMARVPGLNDSASSEFFIMFGPVDVLDGDYAAFGMVVEGMEIIDKFQELERVLGGDGAMSSPVEPVVIKKMTVIE